MQDAVAKSRKILYYALAIACVVGIVWTLYKVGFYSYSLTYKYQAKWFPDKMLVYKIYNSGFLGYVSNICFYAGLVSVFALWKKPRPNWMFVLVITAAIIPKIVNGAVGEFFVSNIEWPDYYMYFNIIPMIISFIWAIARLIIFIKLFNRAEATAKPVMLIYLIIISFGIFMSVLTMFVIFGAVFQYMYIYFNFIADIVLYVLTLRFLKKGLGEDMPFIKTMRMLKEQCTNIAPE